VEKDNKKGPWITDTTKGLQYDFSDLDNKVQNKFEVIAKKKEEKACLERDTFRQTSLEVI